MGGLEDRLEFGEFGGTMKMHTKAVTSNKTFGFMSVGTVTVNIEVILAIYLRECLQKW